ncbi:MAG: 3'(2'),5'-bisphosphate nucleotidase CysQ [Elusimicrobiota bacterium]
MLNKLVSIARNAGKLILEVYDSDDFQVSFKKDLSPLTRADKLSNEFIIEELKREFKIPCISEESPVPYETRREWKEYFLIDPLDGSKDFIAKNGEFSINIALITDNNPKAGVIYAPFLDELFFAESGGGAFINKDGKTLRMPQFEPPDHILVKSRFHDTDQIDEFIKLNSITEVRQIGSSLKFGRLSLGTVNIYPRYNGSKEWDIAAGHIILKEAGGNILDLTTMIEPVYNKPSFENNYFIAFSGKVNPMKVRYLRK